MRCAYDASKVPIRHMLGKTVPKDWYKDVKMHHDASNTFDFKSLKYFCSESDSLQMLTM